MQKYYIYCRSNEDSQKYSNEHSNELQEKLISEYVWDNNLNVTRIFCDVGKKFEARELMIKRIIAKQANGIVVFDESRLSRDVVSANKIINLLDSGVIKEIRTLTNIYGNDPTSILLLTIKLGLINFEIKSAGEMVKISKAAAKNKKKAIIKLQPENS